MPAVVTPAITAETAEAYKAGIERLQPFAERVHIDISDGEFAPTTLIGPGQMYWPANWKVDIHAMVNRPSEYLPSILELKPQLVIFHVEAQEDLLPTMQQLKQVGIRAGIALQRKTVPRTVKSLIEAADHALIFCGDLGHYGGVASLMQLEKVRLIRMIRPNIEIGWDGGASIENAFSLAQGGIDVINSGGAINQADDPATVYKKMLAEANKQSVI